MKIPLVDLKRQYLTIKTEIDTCIREVIENAKFILGDNVRSFENEFASYCGSSFAVGVSSGTSALHLALLSCGIKEGDEVITTVFTFTATAESILYCKAKPVFVDIDEQTFNIDISQIESRISEKTKAIIPVHLYGRPVDMDRINQIAKKYNIKVIEDAAQAHGAYYNGKRIGSISDVGCFSFYPGKNLGAYGDGGIVITNNEAIVNKVKLLRDHGRTTKYEHLTLGYNARLDELQAAVLRVKLKYLDQWNRKRQQLAQLYNDSLNKTELILPYSENSVYHLYVVKAKNRNTIMQMLKEKDVSFGIHYPVPLHLQKAFSFLGYKKGDFPVAEKVSEEVLSLPMFPELKEEEIKYITNIIKNID